MDGRMEFREKLSGVLVVCFEQGMRITMDEVEKYFEEDHLSEEQIESDAMICSPRKLLSVAMRKKAEQSLRQEKKRYLQKKKKNICVNMREILQHCEGQRKKNCRNYLPGAAKKRKQQNSV